MQDSQTPPQVVSLDWLAFSVTLALTERERIVGHAILSCPTGYQLLECKHGTPQYKRRYILQTDGGDKVLTLLLEPHSAIIHPHDMYVEVANSILYTPRGAKPILELLAQIHQFSFHSLSRIDVACDFQPTADQMSVIRGLQDLSLYAQGKREGAQFHDYHRPADGGRVERVARCISWGSKQSSVKWKLYNKSLEITEIDTQGRAWCNKPYIPARWAEEGMTAQGVWRLEVSLTGASSFDWRGDKMGWQLIERDLWHYWYWDMVATRFTIRRNEGHQCRKNDTIVPLLDIPDVDHYRLRERVADSEQHTTEHAATLRACVKELERPEVAYSAQWRDLWLRTTAEVIERGHLEGYFLRTFGEPFEEWACRIGDPLMLANA